MMNTTMEITTSKMTTPKNLNEKKCRNGCLFYEDANITIFETASPYVNNLRNGCVTDF